MKVPALLLRQLYTYGSLENAAGGVRFSIKNRLSDATIVSVNAVRIDGQQVPIEQVTLRLADESHLRADAVSEPSPLAFDLGQSLGVVASRPPLEPGRHEIAVDFEARPFGKLSLVIKDAIQDTTAAQRRAVPYDKDDNTKADIVGARRDFVRDFSGVELGHVLHYSFDPAETRGNIENFTGVAQIPIGFAGPIEVNGEHAQGEFVIPLATTEGTLVASYNRGIKVLNLAGGVTCTVSDDKMNRAPVFVFDSAREARDFRDWIDENLGEIRDAAEATSSIAKLLYIDTYLSNKFAYLRFNFTTGDAAGQNMVGRATFAACGWILERVDTVRRFYLESNLATDKKASQVNVMRTRGKRVTAEATIPRRILMQNLRVRPEALHNHNSIANVGAFISGANNNGAHSPNAITAMFIATGQDVANVSESSAGILYTEIDGNGDLYISLTIPSLIVATYGGGTGLPTQRECLEVLGCWGKGKVKKLAEIVAGVALAGELSLGAAISSLDWVSAHERYGRNR